MNILYFGHICDSEQFKIKSNEKNPFFIAQFSFEQALLNQLKNETVIEINSIYQCDYFPKNKKILYKKTKKENIFNITFVNLPLLKELTFFISTFFIILKWHFKYRENKDKIIFFGCHYPPVSLGIYVAKKILGLKSIVTFTDLTIFTYAPSKIKKMKFYKRKLIKYYLKLIDFLQNSYDGYILFSKQMNEVLNYKNKPYVVIEGIYNNMQNYKGKKIISNKESSNKIIIHAGTLNKEVGIDKILDVFKNINAPDFQLWFFGKGDMDDEIKDASKIDKRITHFGFVDREKMNNLMLKGDILINLRNPKDEFTKYSFPSKMFEYMASGVPVFTTKLDGIPTEYYRYVYSLSNYDTKKIALELEKILRGNRSELDQKGRDAKKFIEEHKNEKVQADKIKKFIKEINIRG